ncbi:MULTISPECIES: FecR domain-containing protein [Cupriavidus]
MSRAAPPAGHAALDQAIAWKLAFEASGTAPADDPNFAAWLASDASHAAVWQRLCALDARFAGLQAGLDGAARRVLDRVPAKGQRRAPRRAALAAVAAFALAAGAAMLDALMPLSGLGASYLTLSGKREQVILPDATRLYLHARTAVDLEYDDKQRLLVLREGEIVVETAHDAGARPFLVRSGGATLRALGTRFLVRREGERTYLVVLASAVAARAADGQPETVVRADQSLLLEDGAAGRVAPARRDEDAWTDGMLVVNGRPLGEVVRQLGRGRFGHLGVDADIAALPVTGTFSLDDLDVSLAALSRGLPVQVERTGPWWVQLKRAPGR